MEDAKNWVESAKKVKGVEGFMYTTWRNDDTMIEALAKVCGEGAASGRE